MGLCRLQRLPKRVKTLKPQVETPIQTATKNSKQLKPYLKKYGHKFDNLNDRLTQFYQLKSTVQNSPAYSIAFSLSLTFCSIYLG